MKKAVKLALITLPIICLILVRMFEDLLFYDPFLTYFNESFRQELVPDFNGIRLFFNHLFRFFLNTGISLWLLWLLFKNLQFIKIAGFLYLILFVILLPVYFVLISSDLETHTLITFYIRRFLIQPILVFILIPAFFYQLKFMK